MLVGVASQTGHATVLLESFRCGKALFPRPNALRCLCAPAVARGWNAAMSIAVAADGGQLHSILRLDRTLRLKSLCALETMLPRPDALRHLRAPAVAGRRDASMLVSIASHMGHATVLLES